MSSSRNLKDEDTMSRTAETGEKESKICDPNIHTIHYAADLFPGTMNTAAGEFRISLHLVGIRC